MLILHGAFGGLDELVIAVVAIGVLWIAVKLAGRKSGDEDEETATSAEEEQPHEASARHPIPPWRTTSLCPDRPLCGGHYGGSRPAGAAVPLFDFRLSIFATD